MDRTESPASSRIAADTTPLAAGGWNFKTHVVGRPRDGVFVLKPAMGMRLFSSVFLAFGAAAILFVLLGPYRPPKTEGWVVVGAGLVFLAVGVILLFVPRRFELDRNAGTIASGRLFHRRTRALADVLAVQLIEGGWHTVKGQHGTRSTYFTYQLNLVLADANSLRLNLTNHTQWEATWQAAHQLAEFLNVPLLDEVSQNTPDE